MKMSYFSNSYLEYKPSLYLALKIFWGLVSDTHYLPNWTYLRESFFFSSPNSTFVRLSFCFTLFTAGMWSLSLYCILGCAALPSPKQENGFLEMASLLKSSIRTHLEWLWQMNKSMKILPDNAYHTHTHMRAHADVHVHMYTHTCV